MAWNRTRRTVAGLLVAGLAAGAVPPAVAGDVGPEPWAPLAEEPIKPRPTTSETLVVGGAIFTANWLDAKSTQDVVAAGGYERLNPALYGRYGERVVPVKMAFAAAETGVFIGLAHWRKDAAWAWAAGVVVATVWLGCVRNDQLANRLRTGTGAAP